MINIRQKSLGMDGSFPMSNESKKSIQTVTIKCESLSTLEYRYHAFDM